MSESPEKSTTNEAPSTSAQESSRNRVDPDAEDDVAPIMMASYTEISDRSSAPTSSGESAGASVSDAPAPPRRPHSLSAAAKPLDLDGRVIHREGDMTHFVADDLEYRIKISSPVVAAKNIDEGGETPATDASPRRLVGRADAQALNDLENESRRIAQSVDNLIENLSGVLHSISSITADNVEAYKDSVSKTCDAIDSNIKCMYTILAKGEEVFQAMAPVQTYAARLTEIRRLLNLFESNL